MTTPSTRHTYSTTKPPGHRLYPGVKESAVDCRPCRVADSNRAQSRPNLSTRSWSNFRRQTRRRMSLWWRRRYWWSRMRPSSPPMKRVPCSLPTTKRLTLRQVWDQIFFQFNICNIIQSAIFNIFSIQYFQFNIFTGMRSYLRNTSPLARRGDSVCSDPCGSMTINRHSDYSLNPAGPNSSPGSKRKTLGLSSEIKLPLNAKIIPKQLAKNYGSGSSNNTGTGPRKKKKKKSSEKKQDRKAAKTLSAILLAFIITWTPYNVMVLIKPLLNCEEGTDCIPASLWNFGYYLCYINSTINPMLYALCNASFRRTYIRILTCKWHNKRRHGVQRGYYSWKWFLKWWHFFVV